MGLYRRFGKKREAFGFGVRELHTENIQTTTRASRDRTLQPQVTSY